MLLSSSSTSSDTANVYSFVISAETIYETLITYPLTQTHNSVPEEIREKLGITGRLLRLSVGIEDANDIIKDLENAMK